MSAEPGGEVRVSAGSLRRTSLADGELRERCLDQHELRRAPTGRSSQHQRRSSGQHHRQRGVRADCIAARSSLHRPPRERPDGHGALSIVVQRMQPLDTIHFMGFDTATDRA